MNCDNEAHGEIITDMATIFQDIPKHQRKAWRSQQYKRFIQLQDCHCCGAAALNHAHHHNLEDGGVMGSKVPDMQLLPLCGRCHRNLHDGSLKLEGDIEKDMISYFRKWLKSFFKPVIYSW